MLKLSIPNAQSSRVIIVVVQLGVVKIYRAMVKALRNKEWHDETQFTTKIDGFDGFWEYFTYSLVMKNILKTPLFVMPDPVNIPITRAAESMSFLNNS